MSWIRMISCLAGDQMPVRHGACDNRAVVLVFAGPKHEPLARALFRYRNQRLVIQLDLAGPQYDDRQAGGVEHCPQRSCGCLACHPLPGAVGGRELEHDQVGACCFGRLSPGAGIVDGVAPGADQWLGPLVGRVGRTDLDGNLWAMRRLALEVYERQCRRSADSDGVAAGAAFGSRCAQRDLAHRTRPLLDRDLDIDRHRKTLRLRKDFKPTGRTSRGRPSRPANVWP
jgi:hypothetical protein